MNISLSCLNLALGYGDTGHFYLNIPHQRRVLQSAVMSSQCVAFRAPHHCLLTKPQGAYLSLHTEGRHRGGQRQN